ncbi:MAG: DUF4340 domain-containing protein [Deltaproteobacteria bacterium]|nr:DUF4340 domain-containing protein [Deltaproteobacteria bacterium]
MNRNIVALAVLVVLALVAFLVFRKPVDGPQKPVDVLRPVPADKLDGIRVVRTEGKGAQAKKEEIVLAKGKDGWRMAKPVPYAVTATSVEAMVKALAELKVVDAIAENKSRHQALQVDDEMGVEVTALQGTTELARFVVGMTTSDMTFVRLPGKDTVYRVTGSLRTAFNKSAGLLREKTIFDLDKDSVTKMAFTNAAGELAVERNGEGEQAAWTPVGAEIANFDSKKMDGIARSLAQLTTRDFQDAPLGPETTGLTEGAAKVVFDAAKAGQKGTFTLWIGNNLDKERETWVKTSISDQIFLASTSMIERFKAKGDEFARTDKQVAEEAEREKKAAEARAQRGQGATPPPGMGWAPGAGPPGGGQIPPEVLQKLRAQMATKPLRPPPSQSR